MLTHYYDTYATPSNGVLAIVGDVDPRAIAGEITSLLDGWSGPEVALPARSHPPAPTEARRVSLEKGRNQVHVVLGFPGLAVDDADVPALDVLTQVLSGQGGRLFLELRDRQSLAYTVTALAIEGVDPGLFAVYIASAPDKLDAAVAGLRSELEKLLSEPIDGTELDRAKNYLIGSQAVSMQRFGVQASLLSLDELYGLGATHHLGYAERIEAVTLDDLERVAQRTVHLDTALLAVVE